VSTFAPSIRHLPPWKPEPRICASCRSELPVSRYQCPEVELRSARQDDPSVTVRVLGTICRFCALVEEPSTEKSGYHVDV
jgi:hypothetical protein